MKKLVVLFTLFFSFTFNAFAFYSDVSEESPYYDSIQSLNEMGRLPDGDLFDPDGIVTQADLIEMLLAYLQMDKFDVKLQLADKNRLAKHQILKVLFDKTGIGLPLKVGRDFPFVDLKKDSEIALIAQRAAHVGIFELANPTFFKMSKSVTRAELADYLYKVHQYEPVEEVIAALSDADFNNQVYKSLEEQLLNSETFEVLLDVWKTLKTDFLNAEEIDDEELINGAIRGMVESAGDNYTTYHDPDEVKSFANSVNGNHRGIGMTLDMIEEELVIVSLFADSPAAKAGMKSDDVLLEVNGEKMAGRSVEYAVSKVLGPLGTTVEIAVLRKGVKLKFNVLRDFSLDGTVDYALFEEEGKRLAYVRFVTFAKDSFAEFLSAAERAVSDDVDGVILDLRNNPGGFMDVAIDVIGLFTSEVRTAVTLEFSNGSRSSYQTNGNGLLESYPVVVLINEGSASASEILAGALQDYERAKIVGVDSFGKATVQRLKEYSNGALFRFSVSHWLTPKGRNLKGIGVRPDLFIANFNSSDRQFDAAVDELLK